MNNNKLVKVLLAVFGVSLVLTCIAWVASDVYRPVEREEYTETWWFDDISDVEASFDKVSIEVVYDDVERFEVSFAGTRRMESLKPVTLEASLTAGTLSVKENYPGFNAPISLRFGARVSDNEIDGTLTIKIPRGKEIGALTLSSIWGRVSVQDIVLKYRAHLGTVIGVIDVRGLRTAEMLSVSSQEGRVEISGVTSEGSMFIEGHESSMNLNNVTAKFDISVETWEGGIKFDNVKAGGGIHVSAGTSYVNLTACEASELYLNSTMVGYINIKDCVISKNADIRAYDSDVSISGSRFWLMEVVTLSGDVSVEVLESVLYDFSTDEGKLYVDGEAEKVVNPGKRAYLGDKDSADDARVLSVKTHNGDLRLTSTGIVKGEE